MKIVSCTCEHKYQDDEYGKGRRQANPTSKEPATFRCTVCGSEHALRSNKIK